MKRPTSHRPRSLSGHSSPGARRGTVRPSSGDIAQARTVLDALIIFLNDVRRTLDAPAAAAPAPVVAASTHALGMLLRKSQDNPALTLAIGTVARKARRSTTHHAPTPADLRTQELCDMINRWL